MEKDGLVAVLQGISLLWPTPAKGRGFVMLPYPWISGEVELFGARRGHGWTHLATA